MDKYQELDQQKTLFNNRKIKMKKIKLYLNKIYSSIISFLNKEKYETIIESLAITNFSINKGSYILFWSIAAFSICFVVWASLASVDQVVRASGSVVPVSKVHTVQSRVNGVVEKINIKMSDEVEKGQVLFLINHEVAKNRYNLAKATRDALERKVQLIEDLFNRGSEAEVKLIEEKLRYYEAEKTYQLEKINLEFSKIISPVKGTISQVDVVNVEQVVQNGQQIASIVPYNDKLQVLANVLPKDIAYVIPGLKARLAFNAYDMAIFGQFDGIVKKVAPTTTKSQDEKLEFYETIIEIDLTKQNNDKKVSLQSGMQVDVSIIGQERTVLSYIINPISKLSKTALRD